jgi:hypothetical protein
MQQACKFKVRSGEFAASVDDHDDGCSFVKRDAGLAENFRRDEVFIFGKNASGVDDAESMALPFGLAVEAVARNAGLVADNRAPRSDDTVEKR